MEALTKVAAASTAGQFRTISIVTPLFNEEENVVELLERIGQVIHDLPYNCEVIAVDDGSTDGTFKRLREQWEKRKDINLRIVRLRKNFGQSAALRAGIDRAGGDVIVLIDGDLQNDPQDIPHLLQKITEGYDIVSGWRVEREDPLLSRTVPSRVANWLIAKFTGVHLHDYGCTLKAYRREVISDLPLYGEMHRFIPALAASMGAVITEIPVRHHPRKRGRSKYGLSRITKVLADLIAVTFFLSYSSRPMHVLGTIGAGLLLLGGAIIVKLVIERFAGVPLSDRPLFIGSLVSVLFGLQMISLGLILEFLARIYFSLPHKSVYHVREEWK
ncbi:MAG: glycosyltransferase family 2 protein [Candidatus Methanomethyliaceae archaeon]